MWPTQVELNEYVDRLSVLLKDLFNAYFSQISVEPGNGDGVTLTLEHQESDNILEVVSSRKEIYVEFESTHWHYHEAKSGTELFEQVMYDVLSILKGNVILISGFKGEKWLGTTYFMHIGEREAISDFKSEKADCDRMEIKKWGKAAYNLKV